MVDGASSLAAFLPHGVHLWAQFGYRANLCSGDCYCTAVKSHFGKIAKLTRFSAGKKTYFPTKCSFYSCFIGWPMHWQTVRLLQAVDLLAHAQTTWRLKACAADRGCIRISSMRKSWECRVSNLGPLGARHSCYLWAMWPPKLVFFNPVEEQSF